MNQRLTRDTFCSYCGTKYDETLAYPRRCRGCTTQVWANPIPVGVGLVPVVAAEGTGLLVIRRAIPPQIGKLALVGGFLEEHESWQQGVAREVRSWEKTSDHAPAWIELEDVAPIRFRKRARH